MMAQIAACEGFVRNDGSALAEMYEQLDDEVTNYERKASDAERMHRRKSAMVYTPTVTPTMGRMKPDLAPGFLVGISDNVLNRRIQLFARTCIGRSQDNEIPLVHGSSSRRHACITYVNHRFVLNDLGSTNGCLVNGQTLSHAAHELLDGDIVKMGDVEFRCELKRP